MKANLSLDDALRVQFFAFLSTHGASPKLMSHLHFENIDMRKFASLSKSEVNTVYSLTGFEASPESEKLVEEVRSFYSRASAQWLISDWLKVATPATKLRREGSSMSSLESESAKLFEATVGDLTEKVGHVAQVNSTAKEAAVIMDKQGLDSLVVTQDSEPVGIITETDFVRKVAATGSDPNIVRLRDIMSTPPITIRSTDSIDEAIVRMLAYRIRRLVVIDETHTFLGLLTIDSVAKWASANPKLYREVLSLLTHADSDT